MTQIKSVVAKDDHQLEVTLENGSSIVINMTNRLNTIRFALLRDIEVFKNVTTDGNFVRWKDKIEISITELCQLAQK